MQCMCGKSVFCRLLVQSVDGTRVARGTTSIAHIRRLCVGGASFVPS
jgi:hypothetical protein